VPIGTLLRRGISERDITGCPDAFGHPANLIMAAPTGLHPLDVLEARAAESDIYVVILRRDDQLIIVK
jgi:hypothetical protein